MIRVNIKGTHKGNGKKKGQLWVDLTGSPHRDGNWDLMIDGPTTEYRQKIRPETVKLLIKFLDAIEADQKHFAAEEQV